MTWYKEDFYRLKKYAEGMGIKITITNTDDKTASAAWSTDGSEITLYNWSGTTYMQQSLAFLHEIAHHLAWVRSGRKVDLKTDKALYLHDAQDDNEKLDKKYRKLIYLSEKNDAAYHEQIHNELNLKLPIWRVKAERDLDIWIYFRFYQSGKYPKRKERTQKRKELIKKYKEL